MTVSQDTNGGIPDMVGFRLVHGSKSQLGMPST